MPAVLFLAVLHLLPLVDLTRISLRGDRGSGRFERAFGVPLSRVSLFRTMQIALAVARLCALFGSPTALLIQRSKGIVQVLIATAVVLPFFIATLIRTYA